MAEIANAWISILPDTSKIAPGIKSAFSSAMPDVEKSGRSIGSSLGGAVKKTFTAGFATASVAAVGAVGTAMAKGFGRLTAIENAEAKLKGLGNSAETVSGVMDNALAAVKGTAHGLGEAASTSAGLVAAGIKPGQELEQVLKTVGDTAAIAGRDMQDVGVIFGSIAARGKLQGDDMLQLMESGIPVLQLLAKETGKTSAEVSEMVTKGQIDFATFERAMRSGVGGAALEMGNTVQGALANLGSAMGRVGAVVLGPVFSATPKLLTGITTAVDGLTDSLKPASEQVGKILAPAFETIGKKIAGSAPFIETFGKKLGDLAVKIATIAVNPDTWSQIGKVFSALAENAASLWPAVENLATSFFEVSASVSPAVWSSLVAVLNAVVPIIENVLVPVLEKVADLAKENPGLVQAMVVGFLGMKAIGVVAGPIGTTVTVLKNLGGAAKFVTTAFKGGGGIASGLVKIMGGARSANPIIAGLGKGVGGFTKVLSTVGKFVGPLVKVFSTVIRFVNPWVAGFTLAAAALTWFFTKTELGQSIWQKFVDVIKIGVDWVVEKFNTVKNALEELFIAFQGGDWGYGALSSLFGEDKAQVIVNAVTIVGDAMRNLWSGIQTAWSSASTFLSSVWTGILKPIFDGISTALQFVAGIVFTVFATPFIVAWNLISSAISFAWSNYIQPTFSWIGEKLQFLGLLFQVWWQQVVKPSWDAFGNGIRFVIDTFILPAWETVKFALQNMGTWFSLVWTTLIKPAWDALGAGIRWTIDTIIKPAFEGMKAAVNTIGAAITFAWTTLIKPAWDALGAGIRFVVDTIVKPAFEAVKSALHALGAGFSFAWNTLIKPAWDAFAAGVRTVVDVVVKPAFEGLKVALRFVGDAFSNVWNGVIKPAWTALGTGIKFIVDSVVKPAFDGIKTALKTVGDFFTSIVSSIKSTWGGLRSALAQPINFMINTVYNRGIRVAWNAAGEFLPDLKQAPAISGIPEYRSGGRITGPGTGTSDDVLMWGSHGEHMLTAKEVIKAGGHNAIYFMRDLLASGTPFRWDGGKFLSENRKSVNAFGAQVRQKGIGRVSDNGLYSMLPKYKKGGEIRPMWETQLENGHRAAKKRNGNPYTWGHEDCSGYMSMIADAIINGGDGVRKWATGSFPGGQPWVKGLGKGFSVGVHDNPGGPGGGHTAGTLTGVGPYATVNVESGGSHGHVAYGGPAAGADHPQFAGKHPGLFHLAIGADGAFESAGGPSPAAMIMKLKEKIKEIFSKVVDPIEASIASHVGTPPPEFFATVPAFMKKIKDMGVDKLMSIVENLSNLLAGAYNKARELTSIVIPSFLRDTGGWLPTGLSLVRNETGKPEAVLNWAQFQELNKLLENVDWAAAEQAGHSAAAKEFASAFGVDEADSFDPHIVGMAIGKELGTTAASSALGLFGLSELVDVATSLDNKWQAAWKEHLNPKKDSEALEATKNAEATEESPTTAPEPAATVVDSDVKPIEPVTVKSEEVTVTQVPAKKAPKVAKDIGGRVVTLNKMPDLASTPKGPDGYAKGIVQAALARRLPEKGAMIGMATALVESGDPLRMWANRAVPESLKYHHDAIGSDHDSVGLFQQRNNGAWGTVADRMDPKRSAGLFFDAMLRKFPKWQSMNPGAVAQGVQVSAFPDRYATKMNRGLQLVKQTGLYDQGGWLLKGLSLVRNETGKPEPVLTHSQWGDVGTMIREMPMLTRGIDRLIPELADIAATGDFKGTSGLVHEDSPLVVGALRSHRMVRAHAAALAQEANLASGSGGTFNITLEGDAASMDAVEGLITELDEKIEGVSLLVRRSREAGVLSGLSMMV